MNETRLCTIGQIEQFLGASAQIEFTTHGDGAQCYEHISSVLKRFDYPAGATSASGAYSTAKIPEPQ